MLKRALIVALTCLVLSAVVVPVAQANSPDDGIYIMQASSPATSTITIPLSLHQTGTAVLITLIHLDGTWTFGVGSRSGNTISGNLYRVDNTLPDNTQPAGTFNFTVSGGSLTGQFTLLGPNYTVTANKVF